MVFECVVMGVSMSSNVWWSEVIVGEGSGNGADATHSSGWVSTCDVSGDGAGVAHMDDSDVVVVAVFCDVFWGDLLWVKPAQKSSP